MIPICELVWRCLARKYKDYHRNEGKSIFLDCSGTNRKTDCYYWNVYKYKDNRRNDRKSILLNCSCTNRKTDCYNSNRHKYKDNHRNDGWSILELSGSKNDIGTNLYLINFALAYIHLVVACTPTLSCPNSIGNRGVNKQQGRWRGMHGSGILSGPRD